MSGYNDRKAVYLKAFQIKGLEHQLDIAIEEMSELTKELCKYKRGYSNMEHIIEEVADVHVVLEEIELAFNIQHGTTEEYMNRKVERLNKSLCKRGGMNGNYLE